MTTPAHERPRVVVGVDGSEGSKQALRWAAYVATTAGAPIEAVTAWDFPLGYGWGTVPQNWSVAQDAEVSLKATVDDVLGAEQTTDVRLTVLEGNAARILLEQSVGAFMLVVGSRGHGGFTGLLLGSVSASVAEHARCPVLVVHGATNPPP